MIELNFNNRNNYRKNKREIKGLILYIARIYLWFVTLATEMQNFAYHTINCENLIIKFQKRRDDSRVAPTLSSQDDSNK